ncbi:MAG: hypothetical protein ABIF82_13015 [Planctomycetota bacterium]
MASSNKGRAILILGSAALGAALLALVGASCKGPEFSVINCYGVSPGVITQAEWEAAKGELSEYVSQEMSSPGKLGDYARGKVDSCFKLPRQAKFPKGASIVRGIAVQRGVAEVFRKDLGVTVFLIPGTAPFSRRDFIPSKGDWSENYFIYDVGREGTVLLVIQGHTSHLGGSIEIAEWDITRNHVRVLWSCAGEEDGMEFSHSLGIRRGKLHLTVFGILSQKRKAYEKDRAKLAAELGFPAEFVYDSRYARRNSADENFGRKDERQ